MVISNFDICSEQDEVVPFWKIINIVFFLVVLLVLNSVDSMIVLCETRINLTLVNGVHRTHTSTIMSSKKYFIVQEN